MSRWNKNKSQNFAFPLDVLVKEKENTNRPVAARSAGTVGKWGVTSFTSIRRTNFGLSSFSPQQDSLTPNISPHSSDGQTTPNPHVEPPPKPKKFFKSRNITPRPIFELPKFCLKINKKRANNKSAISTGESVKQKSEKVEKPIKIKTKKVKPIKVKPDPPPPTRILSRTRKTVNYNEENSQSPITVQPERISPVIGTDDIREPEIIHEHAPEPPPLRLESPPMKSPSEHPPIVLRISKGTSRLISSDSEEVNNSPPYRSPRPQPIPIPVTPNPIQPPVEQEIVQHTIGALTSTAELLAVLSDETPPAISLQPDSQDILSTPIESTQQSIVDLVTPDSVVTSQRSEGIKIKIKTHLAKGYITSQDTTDVPAIISSDVDPTIKVRKRPRRKEPIVIDEAAKEPEPYDRASPSDKDFDSQSSIIGSCASSQQAIGQPEDSRVITTRDTDNMTSDQDTSQDSSLVAAPSDIDARLAAMEYDNEPDQDIWMNTPPEPQKRMTRQQIKIDSPPKEGRVTRNNSNGIAVESQRPIRSYSRKRKSAQMVDDDGGGPNSQPNTQSSIITTQESVQMSQSSVNTTEKDTDIESQEIRLSSRRKVKRQNTPLNNNHNLLGSEAVQTPQSLVNATGRDTRIGTPDVRLSIRRKVKKHNVPLNNNLNLRGNGIGTKLNVIDENSSTEREPTDDTDKPSVKLVISKKKGSIFKSRAIAESEGESRKPKRHLYKHKWDDEEREKQLTNWLAHATTESFVAEFDDDLPLHNYQQQTSKLRSSSKLRSARSTEQIDGGDRTPIQDVKKVQNVKRAHQIQEDGECQEMTDDVEYILDTLQSHNPVATRCLSAIQLALKCMAPAFRMHVRAHGTVTQFFKALNDAPSDPTLGLCTAAVMFVLNQDNLNVDLDRDSLELMLNLLEMDSNQTQTPELMKHIQKVRELIVDIKNQGKAIHINIDNITVSSLAMETLLSLSSKRAGEWFKEELRELGGLDHIINTICECCRQISDYVVDWTDDKLEKLRKIERCLRVLENVSLQNEDNQKYILTYKFGYAIDTLVAFYKLCDSEIVLYPTTDRTPTDNPGYVLREALVPTIKILINLTHPFNEEAIGSKMLGKHPVMFKASLHILLESSNYVPEHCVFELNILVLSLLINMTMRCGQNQDIIMKANAFPDFGNRFEKTPAIKALIDYFYKYEEMARLVEKNTDEMLEEPAVQSDTKSKEEVEELHTRLMQKANHHMEHTFVASYICLLIGHLITDAPFNESRIRILLRNGSFSDFINVLRKYFNFMTLTSNSEASSVEHMNQTRMIIELFERCDQSKPGTSRGDQQQTTQKSSVDRRPLSQVIQTYSSYSSTQSSSYSSK